MWSPRKSLYYPSLLTCVCQPSKPVSWLQLALWLTKYGMLCAVVPLCRCAGDGKNVVRLAQRRSDSTISLTGMAAADSADNRLASCSVEKSII